MKNLVVLSGAGMSAESGIPTFRGADGTWENHRIQDVATPEAWAVNPQLVLRFYNERRKRLLEVGPNEGHHILASLEAHFRVHIVTQNVDNLHERAGSSSILHLHGELIKSRSTAYPELVYPIEGWELKWGDLCERGSQLRPHSVWFGEPVPMIEPAIDVMRKADCVIIIGTSMQVYPAAGLIHEAPAACPKYVIDPNAPSISGVANLKVIREGASAGMERVRNILMEADF
ncbi:MAG: SIR2 family NAD-dependent protein deacylase [Bacteroidota bacterium]